MGTKLTAILLAMLLLPLCGCEARQGREEAAVTEPPAATANETEPETEARPPETEPAGEETEPADAEGATAAAEALLAALQTGEAEAIRENIDYRNLLLLDDGSPEASLLAVLRKLSYEIEDVSAEGSAAEATAVLSNVDIAGFFMSYLQKSMELEFNNSQLPEEERAGPEELDAATIELFSAMLDENEGNRKETTVVIRLQKTGENWRARVSDELRDAVTGGYFSAREQASANRGM